MWEPEPPGIFMVHPGLYRNCLTFYVTYGVEEWNVGMAHWKNATEGGKPCKDSEKKRVSLYQNDVLYMLLLNHKVSSYTCYCWTTKWRPIFATVEPQNYTLYLLLLNHKMNSYIWYFSTTQSMIMSEDWNHQATLARCLSRLRFIGLWRNTVWWVDAAILSETAAFIFTAALNT